MQARARFPEIICRSMKSVRRTAPARRILWISSAVLRILPGRGIRGSLSISAAILSGCSSNPEYWDDGDSSAPKGADMFDRTAFGDLTVNPDARVGDPDYGKGYYVFERLGDVMRESSDWIPYFNWLTR